MILPEVTLTHLNRADGSATYTHKSYSIIGAVNGPIEVLRRDEQPEEATIEVNVRPAIGVGSPRERHLETLLHSSLRSIILVRQIPRTLVQLTLQVRSLPEEDTSCGVNSTLTILPHLLHTSLLSLLSASIPLRTTFTSLLVAIPASSETLISPTATQLLRAAPIKSAHVFAFSGDKRLLLNESEGTFSHEEWEEVCEMAEEVCCGGGGGVSVAGGMDVDGAEGRENLEGWLRGVVRGKVEGERGWKRGT